MYQTVLGIDVSKNKFNAALLREDKYKHKVFPNNPDGFNTLISWLQRQGVKSLHICMEATGVYSEPLAQYLHDRGYTVSVVNPAMIKGFSRSELQRSKTDKRDVESNRI